MNKTKELINEILRDYDDAADWKDARIRLIKIAYEANTEMEKLWLVLNDLRGIMDAKP